MPGPKTHHIFYKQLKNKLSTETLSHFPNYDKYSIFAQGHDFLIYYNFYKIFSQKQLNENINSSKLLQEFKFQEFIYNFLKTAQQNGTIENEQIRLFIGPGYVMHHILDAYTHPLIIYYAGDHVRDTNNKTWKHGIIENLIDLYLMDKVEHINHNKYPVHKDFKFDNKTICEGLVKNLNESLNKTYNIANGGKMFYDSFSQISLFLKLFKYDNTGFKRILFDLVDPVLKGTSSFSYHRNINDNMYFLNNMNKEWLNPVDNSIKSCDSFMDLYEKALNDGAIIIERLNNLCISGNIHRDDVYSIIPNIASTHGLECN